MSKRGQSTRGCLKISARPVPRTTTSICQSRPSRFSDMRSEASPTATTPIALHWPSRRSRRYRSPPRSPRSSGGTRASARAAGDPLLMLPQIGRCELSAAGRNLLRSDTPTQSHRVRKRSFFRLPLPILRSSANPWTPQSQKLISQFKTPKSRQRRGFRHTGIPANATAVSGEPSRNRVVGTTERRTNQAKWPTPKHGLSIADSRATCDIRPPLPAPAGQKRLVPRKPDRRHCRCRGGNASFPDPA